ncbi:septation protein SpoVG [Macrococcus brunensis]|uniref:Putative septation protein SpoVG n=1 Tax=Macrococcus brunensis TaxID=198483 RepID=A0A4V3BD87_9STAP|nr:septation regulator SpoVG [Macrococcus brunensis]TDL94236.1 septation protein SpoVG [Macrococcus brunensis]ULG71867.1 septation regulator SpoVG [Macrococcus brunensis]ULG74122.1 septation regulator SpoVG [Macrococcus brunensis]
MKVTDVRLRKIDTDGRMKALVSITLDDVFVIHDLRVIEGNSGMFVAMPSKRTPDGEFRDIAHPINSDMRQEIQQAVMKIYDETPESSSENAEPQPEVQTYGEEEATSVEVEGLIEDDSQTTIEEDLQR